MGGGINEYILNLYIPFFYLCVPVVNISKVMKINVGADFESVAQWWLSNEKNVVLYCVNVLYGVFGNIVTLCVFRDNRG